METTHYHAFIDFIQAQVLTWKTVMNQAAL